MNLKSVTFRCSAAQLARMEASLAEGTHHTRTELISTAIEDFLNYAEREDIAQLDLFALVQHVDGTGSDTPFREHA